MFLLSFFIILSVVAFTAYRSTLQISEEASGQLSGLYKKINATSHLEKAINDTYNLLIDNNSQNKGPALSEFQRVWNAEIADNLSYINSLALTTTDLAEQRLIDTLSQYIIQYKGLYYEISMMHAGNYLPQDSLFRKTSVHHPGGLTESQLSTQLNEKVKKINSVIPVMRKSDEASVTTALEMVKSSSGNNNFLLILQYFIGISFLVIVGLSFTKASDKSITRVKETISEIAKGNIPQKASVSEDELGEILRDTNILIENLENVKEFSNEVGKGNFETDKSVFNNEGDLGGSLAGMRESLRKVAEEDKKRNWATNGLAQIGEILRKNTESAEELYFNIISFLVKYMNSNQGSLFIINDDNLQDKHLELASCYAFDRKKYVNKRIDMGEGLIGQSVLEKDIIYLSDVPNEYISITSGLGGANPRNILIVPLKVNEEIHGVIEIASFHVLEEYQIEFMRKLAESIASSISGVKINERTRKLLEQSQKMTEEMRGQEEELRQNMEEMEATQEEMKRIQEEMRAQNSIFHSIAIVSKTDVQGNITYVNDEFLKWSKYSRDELIGRNHRILKSGHQDDQIFENMWKTISSGKIFRGEIKNRAKDGTYYWVDAIIAPVLDEGGKPKEYIAQRFVINEKKKKEEEMQLLAENLKAQEEELRQNMEEMKATQEEMQKLQIEMSAQNDIINTVAIVSKTDLKGNITYVNEEFLKWAKYTREEVMGKNHRILKSGDQDDKIFENMWQTISSGKIFRGEIKNKAKDGSFYWVDAIIAPVLDENGKPKEYIAQRFVINEQKKKEEEMNVLMEEMKAQEEELRQNMEEMQTTQEEMKRVQGEMQAQNGIINSVAIVSKTDLKGNIIYVNDEFLKWAKYSREEVMGKNHRILKSGDQDDKIFEEMWATISSGKTFRGEIKNKAKDGSFYWVDAIIAPVLDENGKPKEYLAQRFVINDQKRKEQEMMTMMEEMKAQEEELRQNMEEMQATQEEMKRIQEEMQAQNGIINSIAIVSKTDLKGNITYVNEEFLRWAKYSHEEVIGKNHRILKSGDQDDKIFEDMWATISSGKTFRGEIKNKAKDGSFYWVDAIIAPILDDKGKPKEYIAQRFVINDKKKKEEEMNMMMEEVRAQEEELRQNMEEMKATQEEMQKLQIEMSAQNDIINTVAIVSKTDLKGNITYVNEEFLKWSKYTIDEVIGKNHRILKSGDQDDKIFEDMWATISSGKIFRGEIKNKAKDGSYYWVDAIIAPVLDENGKPKEYIAQRFVINEQKEKEQRLNDALAKLKKSGSK